MTVAEAFLTTFLTTDQLAERLHMSRQRLACWRLEGFGPRFHKIGSRVLYSERDVAEWLESRRRASTSEPVVSHS